MNTTRIGRFAAIGLVLASAAFGLARALAAEQRNLTIGTNGAVLNTNFFSANGILTNGASATFSSITNSGNGGVAGNGYVGGTLTVVGNTTFAGATNTANAGIGGNLIVSGTTTLAGTTTALLSGGDAQTQISARAVQQFRITSSGLTVTVGAGSVTDAAGTIYSWSGGTVSLVASRVSYIYWDVQNGSLIALRNAYHQGGVLVATVTTGSSTVSSTVQPGTFAFRPSGVQKFMAKVRNSIPSRVICFGDSLTAGAGGAAAFACDMVFASAQSSYGYNLPNISTVSYSNYGVGGCNANMGLSYIAEITSTASSAGSYANQSVGHDVYSDMAGGSLNNVPENTIINRSIDLAVVCYGANSISTIGYELARIEVLVKTLRERGIEVLLWNGNRRSDSTALACLDTGSYLFDIAQRWGCGYASTWDYVDQANTASNNTFTNNTYASDGSGVHQAIAGQQLYAQGLRSVLCNAVLDKMPTTPFENERLMLNVSSTERKYFPNKFETIFTPRVSVPSTAAGATAWCIPVIVAGKSSGSAVYSVAPGGSAFLFDHPRLCSVDLITELPNGVSATFELQDGSGQMSGTSDVVVTGTSSSIQVTPLLTLTQFKALTPGGWSGSDWNAFGFGNFFAKVVCTATNGANSVNVAGVLVGTCKAERIPWNGMFTSGTWAYEASALDAISWLYTDDTTNNPFVVIPYRGNMLQVIMHSRTASGQFNGWMDGAEPYIGKDLYKSGASLAYSAVFAPGNASVGQPNSGGYGQHAVRIQLTTTVNGSAISSAAQNRRLAIYGAWALDWR